MADQLIDAIHRLSGNMRDLQQLDAILRKNEDALFRLGDKLDDLLAMLDPRQHAFAYTFLMHCKCDGSIPQFALFSQQFVQLLSTGDPAQLRFGGSKLGYLLRLFSARYIDKKEAGKCLALMQVAALRLPLSPQHLTPAHPVFLMSCISAKNYKAALPFVERPCVFVDGAGATARDYMLYCYYGGIVMCSQKRWAEAIKLFSLCMATPALALSMIAVEAYRKYVLASLISNGTVESLPKSTPMLIARGVRAASPAYTELATAYATRDIDEVHRVLSTHQAVYNKDHNWGLVLQASSSLSQQNTLRLTKTFITLPLADVAARFKLRDASEALTIIAKMIERGEVDATINVQEGMVHFRETPDKNDSAASTAKLTERMQEVLMLRKQLDTQDEALALSWTYLMRSIGDAAPAGGAQPMTAAAAGAP